MHTEKCRKSKEVQFSNEKGRLYYYDNAKFILIFLVVAAHFISPLTATVPFCKTIWSTINAFHMPAFIFISGFFAKSYISADRTIKVQRTTTYIIIYLAAQVSVSLFEMFVLKESFPFSIMNARSSLWFLQCLILWHILLPYVERFKPAIVLPVCFVVALWAGYEPQCTNFMAVSRVLEHFPFFLCGYYCSQFNIEKLFRLRVRIPLILLSAALITLIVLLPDVGVGKIFTCNYDYRSIPEISVLPFGLLWVARLAFYAAAFLLGATFLSLIPRRKTIFTGLGANSLSVYILHRFVYLAELQYGWANYCTEIPYGVFIPFGCAVVITLMFSVKPFTYPFIGLQKINTTKMLKNR